METKQKKYYCPEHNLLMKKLRGCNSLECPKNKESYSIKFLEELKQEEQIAQDIINDSELSPQDQTDLNITKCLRRVKE